MSDRLNQHFLPRHHLRLYAGGRRFLSAVLRGTGALVPVASIRGQCARHNYYGDSTIEEELSLLDGRHAPVFRAALEYVWSDGPELTIMQRYRLREAVLLQHDRTPRRAMLRASSINQLMMNAYREYRASEPKTGVGPHPIPLTLKNWTPTVQKGVSTWPTRQSSGRRQTVYIA